MKFAKRIFVGILAVAMLVSCLTLSTSAENAPTLPSDNLEDVLEYLLYDEPFSVENYDGESEGPYVPADSFFEIVSGEASVDIVADSSSDKSLCITNSSTVGAGYRLDLTESGDFKKLFVTSFTLKIGNEGDTNGSDFYVVATLNDYFDNIVLFAAKTAGEKKAFSYSEYNTDRVTYETVDVEDAVPELGVEYEVEIVFSTDQNKYSVTVKNGDALVFTYTDQIAKSEGIASLRYYVKNPNEATTKTYLDNMKAYEGAAVRDVENSDVAAAEFVVAIQELADYSGTSIEKQVEIADLYAKLFETGNGYDPYCPPDEDTELYNKARAVVEGASAYRNHTYAKAFIYYLGAVSSAGDYYDRIDYYEENVEYYYEAFKNGDLAIEADDAEAVAKAIESCDAMLKDFALSASYCENFVRTVEEGYNPNNRNYTVMLAKYGALSALKSRAEDIPEFNYAEINPDTKYPTVADAIAVYEALEAKIAAINYNVEKVFLPAVNAMDMTQRELTENNLYLTENFESLYENYLVALTVYANGTVHPQLDPATYPGLSAVIEKFVVCAEYVEGRVADCLEFVSRVNGASSSPDYLTVVKQLALTDCYFDTNPEYSLDKYAGVEEAIELRKTLEARVVKNEADAAAYIAEVAKIDLEASYLNLKAAVDAAMALKADGDITGIDGIEEANIKLAKAEAIVSSLAGHSSTLIEAVNALKTATTLSERRYLIFVANGAKDSSEDSISGVTAAKAELANQIQKYNSDVQEMNNLFASVVGNVTGTMSSAVSGEAASNSLSVAGVILK